jgi:lipopolysaccharide export system permease protein
MLLRRYNRYIMSLLAWPTLLVTVSLTSIIWLTQALRYIDFIVNRGLSVGSFLYLTALLIPSLLFLVLPIALFISVVFAYNKLASDSELVVMKAAGLSPMQLAKPALSIAVIITLICYAMSMYLMPLTKRQFKEAQTFLRDNYASVLLQEGVFNSPMDGLTVYIREREDNGVLRGILVHDNRNPKASVTMMADEAKLMQSPKGPEFHLINGLRQEFSGGRISWLNFDSYNLDFSFYEKKAKEHVIGQEELFLTDLLNPPAGLPASKVNKFRAEAHQRIIWPLYAIALALLGVAVLSRGDFNRRGQWKIIFVVSCIAVLTILTAIGMSNVIARYPAATPLVYLIVFGVIGIDVMMLTRSRAIAPTHARKLMFEKLLEASAKPPQHEAHT